MDLISIKNKCFAIDTEVYEDPVLYFFINDF